MGILLWVVFGLIAGAIAKFLMPGKVPGGILLTIALGVVRRGRGGGDVAAIHAICYSTTPHDLPP
jgi:uncharacterized membrane protein YeaQ/YmgE (transglycosylase-associated protein family)